MSSVREDIERILSLEEKYGEERFIEGLSNDEQVENKYHFILNLFEEIGKDDSKDKILDEMVQCGALSMEAAAYIFIKGFEDNRCLEDKLRHVFCKKNGHNQDFEAVLYRQKYTEIMKYCSYYAEKLSQMRHINGVFQQRYSHENSDSPFKGRCAVYTVITGNYDKPVEPQVVNPQWDYYCFTDTPGKFSSSIWQLKDVANYCDVEKTKPINRYFKTHPHILFPEYDFTIYVDGNIEIIGDLQEYIDCYSKGCSMLAFPHPSRNSLAEEAEAIVAYKKCDPLIIQRQLDKYTDAGYKDYMPLISAGCMVRSTSDPLLNKTMEEWWNEISGTGPRDQMSFGFVCWKNGYLYDLSNLHIYDNSYIKIKGHG